MKQKNRNVGRGVQFNNQAGTQNINNQIGIQNIYRQKTDSKGKIFSGARKVNRKFKEIIDSMRTDASPPSTELSIIKMN